VDKMNDKDKGYTDEDMFRGQALSNYLSTHRPEVHVRDEERWARAYRAAREAEYVDPVTRMAQELSKASGVGTNPQFWEDVARRAIELGAKLT
jgi:hypothetical protein